MQSYTHMQNLERSERHCELHKALHSSLAFQARSRISLPHHPLEVEVAL